MGVELAVEVVCRVVVGTVATIGPDRSGGRCMTGPHRRRRHGLRLRQPCGRVEPADLHLRHLPRVASGRDRCQETGGIRLGRHESQFSPRCARSGRRVGDYNPQTGTFTTTDPLDGVNGTPTVANPYHYADNDPLNKQDPLGLRAKEGAGSAFNGSSDGGGCDSGLAPHFFRPVVGGMFSPSAAFDPVGGSLPGCSEEFSGCTRSFDFPCRSVPTRDGGAIEIHADAAWDLAELINEAWPQWTLTIKGCHALPPRDEVCGARTYAEQDEIFTNCKVEVVRRGLAPDDVSAGSYCVSNAISARPGTSTHESGQAVDFTCAVTYLNGDAKPGPCSSWLNANGPRFNFHPLAGDYPHYDWRR